MKIEIDLTEILAYAPEYYHKETLTNLMIRVNRSIGGRITFDILVLDNYRRALAYAYQHTKKTVIHKLEEPVSLPNPLWASWLLMRDQAKVSIIGYQYNVDDMFLLERSEPKKRSDDLLAKSSCCDALIIFRDDGWSCSFCGKELDCNGDPKEL